MRFAIGVIACLGVLACSARHDGATREVNSGPVGAVESTSSKPVSPAPVQELSPSNTAWDPFNLSCDNPLYAFASLGATVDEVRHALGERNVRIRSDYDEIWAVVYPDDPERELILELDPERVFAVEARRSTSSARLRGVLRVGDDLAAVERFTGAPLQLSGPDQQTVVVEPQEDDPCRYTVELRDDTGSGDRSNNFPSRVQSEQPTRFRVSALRMARRGPLE